MKRTQQWFERSVGHRFKALGRSPNVIATKLEAMKIKGVSCAADQCPVARLVRKWFRSATHITVGRREVWVCWATADWRRVQNFGFEMPMAVVRFIKLFDQGRFPALIAKKAGPRVTKKKTKAKK